MNNLVFGVTWGLFTIYFASMDFSVNDIAFFKAIHPGVWGVLQLVTDTLSDRVGRKILIYPGMIIQGIGVWIVLIIGQFFYRYNYWHVTSWYRNSTCLSYVTCSN